jgi:mono/diheme cytochrome c family protein
MKCRALLVLLTLGCVSVVQAQRVTTDPARVAAMHERFQLVNAIQTAVIRGDLAAVGESARVLAKSPLQTETPDTPARHANAIVEAAREASVAVDVTGAAVATARMLTGCGSCHRASGTMPAASSPKLPSVGGTVGHMLEHQRAIDYLLRGLVVPSQSEWQSGARALRAAPLHARDLPRDAKLTPELLRVEEAVHRLAEEAVAAESPESRVRVYGTLLSRCAECHSLNRRLWGPPQR